MQHEARAVIGARHERYALSVQQHQRLFGLVSSTEVLRALPALSRRSERSASARGAASLAFAGAGNRIASLEVLRSGSVGRVPGGEMEVSER